MLAEERESHRMLLRLSEEVVATVADAAMVYLVEGDTVRRAIRVHRQPRKEALLDRLDEIAPLKRTAPAVERVFSAREPFSLSPRRLNTLANNPEHRRVVEELDVRSTLFVPMLGHSGVIGVLAAVTVGGGRAPLDDDDATVISELGRRAALTLENARFHEEIVRHSRRMEALAAASHAFAEAALDFDALLDRIAKAIAGSIGDFCSVRLLSGDGERMRLATMHHADEEARRTLRKLSGEALPSAREGLFGKVVAEGESIVLSGTAEEMRRHAPPAVRAYHDRRPVYAMMIVPMRVAERRIGALSVWRERPDDPYVEHDRILLQDLADQAALAVDNARLFAEARSANEAKSRFLALMSHELRTPVNAALGYADLLEMEVGGELGADQVRSVERIKYSCRLLTRLVDELIAYADLDTGDRPLEPVPTALAPLVRRVVSEVGDEAAAKGLAVSVSVPEDLEMVVDPERLRTILLNLLTNAVRFTEEGNVVVEAHATDDRVLVRVSDTGVGIDPEHLDEVFEPFWQVADPHTRATGGMGIGLSLTRHLARHLGGEVDVESEPGKGSTFELALPRTPAGP